MGKIKYNTEEERLEAIRKAKLKSYHKHKNEHRDEINQKQKMNYHSDPDYYKSATKKWREENPEKYRASYLRSIYNQMDERMGRGKGDLTTKWIYENILFKPCAHCGEVDWRKIGCNRLDNTKPHTKDNVEPCCTRCNIKLPRK